MAMAVHTESSEGSKSLTYDGDLRENHENDEVYALAEAATLAELLHVVQPQEEDQDACRHHNGIGNFLACLRIAHWILVVHSRSTRYRICHFPLLLFRPE